MLKVKKLDPRAVLPSVAFAGEDIGYDIFALEDTVLKYGQVTKVRTGIAAQVAPDNYKIKFGLLIRDRSSMASKGIVTSGGVIDFGYTGEIVVLMTNWGDTTTFYCESKPIQVPIYNLRPVQIVPIDITQSYENVKEYIIHSGDKIAQMIPIPVLTGTVVEVEELGGGDRGDSGFGSTGK